MAMRHESAQRYAFAIRVKRVGTVRYAHACVVFDTACRMLRAMRHVAYAHNMRSMRVSASRAAASR